MRGAGALLLAALLVVVPAVPAAADHTAGCQNPAATVTAICFYNRSGDPGPIQTYYSNQPRNICSYVPDDLTSYIVNHTPVRWYVASRTNCSGALAPIYPNTSGAMNAEWNNIIGATYRTSQTSLAEANGYRGPMVTAQGPTLAGGGYLVPARS